MNRKELEEYILDTYGVSPEYPWIKYPFFSVFRHKSNNKWFAVIMTIDKSKLGIKEDGQIDVVNLKCDANIVPSMWKEQGIFPAYHMNKEHWLTVALDGSATDNNLKFLLALSYDLTDKKKR
ncbi:MAG: MmcQ/YjbR family DNA-binding protein [Clostridiales bacterium]|nr:MmcQ/YjbR family DNA-binding protein [Clostridiales bacterium]